MLWFVGWGFEVLCCGFCIYDLSDGDLKLCVVHFVFMVCGMGIWSCVSCTIVLWFVKWGFEVGYCEFCNMICGMGIKLN